MPRGYYDPKTDIFYECRPDPFDEEEICGPWDDDFLEGRVHKEDLIPAKLTVDPEKQKIFRAILDCFRRRLEFLVGRIEVRRGIDPRNMVIHIYADYLLFDNMFGHTLRDLGQIARSLSVRVVEDGIHAQVIIPFYVVKYETENGEG